MRKHVYANVSTTDAVLNYLVELVMTVTPHNGLSNNIKTKLINWRGATIGKGNKFWRDVWIDDYKNLIMGNNITLGKSVMLISAGGITIEDEVMIAHGAQIISAGHQICPSSESLRFSGLSVDSINIRKGAWIGAGAIVLPGVQIEEGAIVGAGSVVTRSVSKFSIVAGNPATYIGSRNLRADPAT